MDSEISDTINNNVASKSNDLRNRIFFTILILIIYFSEFILGYFGAEFIMANKTIKEILKDINIKIEHIEDISADNRATIIKLVNAYLLHLKFFFLHW